MDAARKRVTRGLQNIRTHAGRAYQKGQPYHIYLRIGALEMEKARRATERESAMARVNEIDARFHEIEAEKDALLKIVATDADKLLSNRHGNHPKTAGNFKIRY